MQPIIRAFAIFLAVAMVGENTYAQERQEIGENCSVVIRDNGVFADCDDPNARAYAAVGVSCKNNTTELSIATGKFMWSDQLRLLTALDYVETPKWDWAMTSGNLALAIRPAIPTIKEMLNHEWFRFRIIESGGVHDGNINIVGPREAIKPVREACGW